MAEKGYMFLLGLFFKIWANTPTMTPWGGLLILILLLASISLVAENKKYMFSWHVL
jgi:hypothetical protein